MLDFQEQKYDIKPRQKGAACIFFTNCNIHDKSALESIIQRGRWWKGLLKITCQVKYGDITNTVA